MLKQTKIKDDNGSGEYSIFHSPDFEFVNPVEHYSTLFIGVNVSMMRDIVLHKKPPFPVDIIEKVIFKEAVKDWNKKLEEIK